jgi:predicted nucleic acid-binding protein
LEHWFEALSRTIVCLPWDAAVSRQWAKLVVALKRKGTPVPLLDGMIAATALEHGLSVATRNVNDFKPTGVKVVNPFA